jgi:hypothetical protein
MPLDDGYLMSMRTKSQMAEHSDWWSSSCRGSRLGLLICLCATGLSILVAPVSPRVWAEELRLTNPTSIDRPEEVVEIPLDQVESHLHFSAAQLQWLVATDVAAKQRIPSQFYSSLPGADPDTLLLLVQLPAKGAVHIAFRLEAAAPPQEPWVASRVCG